MANGLFFSRAARRGPIQHSCHYECNEKYWASCYVARHYPVMPGDKEYEQWELKRRALSRKVRAQWASARAERNAARIARGLPSESTPSVLELASAYLDLLRKISEDKGSGLTFKGLDVSNGSAILKFEASDLDAAREGGMQAELFLIGKEYPPPGLQSITSRVKKALQPFQGDSYAEVIIGPWKCRLSADGAQNENLVIASLSLRAVPKRVGGSNPVVRFESESEEKDFTLLVDKDMARRIGSHLYRELDIVAEVMREPDGTIRGGTLEDFFPIEEGENVSAWRKWYDKYGLHFNSVEDAHKELRESEPDDADVS
jgi:hypothetical protein